MMRMESPLEVLSRAVSIVQSENKSNKITGVPVSSSSDSGIEDDMMNDSAESPNSLKSQRKACKKEYDSDEGSPKSPERLHKAVEYLKKSSPENPEVVSDVKKDPDSPPGSISKSTESTEFKYISSNVIKRSPRHDAECRKSPDKLHKAVEFLYRSSPKVTLTKSNSAPDSVIKSSPKRDYEECRQKSPERLFNSSRYSQNSPHNFRPNNRLSPHGESKRPHPCHERDELKSKKIKLEEPDEYARTERYGRSKSTSPKHRISGSPGSVMDSKSGKPDHGQVQYLPRYMHSYPPYPPLFVLADKQTNYSKLMATYDSIFAPTPPLLPPYLPPMYSKCNCGDKNCTLTNAPKYSSPPPIYKEKHADSNDYGLPNVDEHFRKSLGEKYEQFNTEKFNKDKLDDRPSSVDDHFAKALGKKWFSLDGSKKT